MTLCHHCHRRKAKRHCPALRGELCQLCCGEIRQKRVNCPSSCPYLQHQTYQEQRKWQKFKGQPKQTLTEERLAWLAAQIEMALHRLAQQQKEFKDRDAFRLLNYARDKIAAGDQRIILPEEKIEGKHNPGEVIVEIINKARFEKGLVLSVSSSGYSREEKMRCLEALMGLIYEITGGNFNGRIYLEDLAKRAEKAQKEQSSQKIIIP